MLQAFLWSWGLYGVSGLRWCLPDFLRALLPPSPVLREEWGKEAESRQTWQRLSLVPTVPYSPPAFANVAYLQPIWELNKKAKHISIFNEWRNKWLLFCPPKMLRTKKEKEKEGIKKKKKKPNASDKNREDEKWEMDII